MKLISYLIQVFYKFLLLKSLFSMLNRIRYYLNGECTLYLFVFAWIGLELNDLNSVKHIN